MEKILALAVLLTISLLVTFQANKVAQRIFPTTFDQSAERRFLYGLIVRAIGIGVFATMTAIFVGATVLLGIAKW